MLLMAVLRLPLSLAVCALPVASFVPHGRFNTVKDLSYPSRSVSYGRSTTSRSAMTMRLPLIGRFRKKKEVKAVEPITVGAKIPEVDVQELKAFGDGTVLAEPASITEILGSGKAILVGLPGAFTPVCTKEHVPGYLELSPQFFKIGVNKIVIINMNDAFVNEEWGKNFGLLTPTGEKDEDAAEVALSDPVSFVSDADGELMKQMGLAEDMGFGIGVRSKRFVMVLEDGVVTDLRTEEESLDACTDTSAQSLLAYLSPESVAEAESTELDGAVVAAVGVSIVALLALLSNYGGSPPSL